MTTTNYDFKKTSAIMDGEYVTGWMDGSVIKAAKTSDNVVPHIGAAGEVSFSENNDPTGSITITIKQNSPTLAKAIALAKAKKVFTFSLVDLNTNRIKAGGNQCRILKQPDLEWASEVSGVEVTVFVADYDSSTD